ncbi:MAG: Pyocin activator protein PrtN [Polymorphum sp.]|nr:Pyocin activator protein PrtN [Polymorphum sp.]
MKTLFLLMAQYDGRTVIPAAKVCDDFFSHLTLPKFLRKVQDGEIQLPLMRMEGSQKSARGVHIEDLATYLETRRAAAKREMQQMAG